MPLKIHIFYLCHWFVTGSNPLYKYLHLFHLTFIFSIDFNPLNYESVTTYSTISELLDNFYYEADKQAKIKLKTNHIGDILL